LDINTSPPIEVFGFVLSLAMAAHYFGVSSVASFLTYTPDKNDLFSSFHSPGHVDASETAVLRLLFALWLQECFKYWDLVVAIYGSIYPKT
jgi:hypothetical protein